MYNNNSRAYSMNGYPSGFYVLNETINQACANKAWEKMLAKEYVEHLNKHTVQNQKMVGIRTPTSICLRVARDISGIASDLQSVNGSILIIGKPGSGKTTLLRDLIRQRSDKGAESICVIDEKSELFPMDTEGPFFQTGVRTDILTGCSKADGIDAVLRNMGPAIIAVDEITAESDCHALMHAGWCGVTLYATAHAIDKSDLINRDIYRPLIASGLFHTLVVLQPDKSWRLERINA